MSEAVASGRERSADLAAAWSLARSAETFVGWLARDFTYTGVPRKDLESEGCLGLLDAALRFDPARGVAFVTYASWWARRRMQTLVARSARIVRRPEGRGAPGWRAPRDVSLDDLVRPGQAQRWCDVLADGGGAHPLEALVRTEGQTAVAREVLELPPLSREVLVARFGLDDRPPQTLAAIGARLGVSRERVRQIESKAIARLRRRVVRSWARD